MSNKQKLVLCRKCNSTMEKGIKKCPSCGAKNKKPFYKKWWFVLIALCVIGGLISAKGGKNKENSGEEMTSSLGIEDAKDNTTNVNSEEDATEDTTTEEITTEESTSATESGLVDGMRPEFKEAMDKYEDFMNEYCDFMKKYSESGGTDLELLTDYATYMEKYSEAMKAFEKWENEEMNTKETEYYLDVQIRINEKLLETTK